MMMCLVPQNHFFGQVIKQPKKKRKKSKAELKTKTMGTFIYLQHLSFLLEVEHSYKL